MRRVHCATGVGRLPPCYLEASPLPANDVYLYTGHHPPTPSPPFTHLHSPHPPPKDHRTHKFSLAFHPPHQQRHHRHHPPTPSPLTYQYSPHASLKDHHHIHKPSLALLQQHQQPTIPNNPSTRPHLHSSLLLPDVPPPTMSESGRPDTNSNLPNWQMRARQLQRYHHYCPAASRFIVPADDLARAALLWPDYTYKAPDTDEEDWPPNWAKRAKSLPGVLRNSTWREFPTGIPGPAEFLGQAGGDVVGVKNRIGAKEEAEDEAEVPYVTMGNLVKRGDVVGVKKRVQAMEEAENEAEGPYLTMENLAKRGDVVRVKKRVEAKEEAEDEAEAPDLTMKNLVKLSSFLKAKQQEREERKQKERHERARTERKQRERNERDESTRKY